MSGSSCDEQQDYGSREIFADEVCEMGIVIAADSTVTVMLEDEVPCFTSWPASNGGPVARSAPA